MDRMAGLRLAAWLLEAVATGVQAAQPAGGGFTHAYVQEDCGPSDGAALTLYFTREPWRDGRPPVPHYRATIHRAELKAGQMVWFDKTPFSKTPAGAAAYCATGGCEAVDARLRVRSFEHGTAVEGVFIPATGPQRGEELSLPFGAAWRNARAPCGRAP